MKTRDFLFPLCLLLIFGSAFESMALKGDSLRPKSKYRVAILPVPTFGSAPETGIHFGAVCLFDLVPRADSLARHSIAKVKAEYTSKKQFIAEMEWTLTSLDQRYILEGKNMWMYFPENYWGQGGNTPDSNEVRYEAYRLEMSNILYRHLGKKWYLGLSQRFQSVYKVRFSEYSPEQAPKFVGIESGISSGFGLALLHDTRTHLLKPKPGERYLSVVAQGFTPVFGSQYTFQSLDLDARYYLKITTKSLLAFQVLGQLKSNDAPFRMQSLMGGENMMRGFYTGRFRDYQQVAAQTEYRFTLYKWLGMAAFTSVGKVYSIEYPERSGHLKAAAGLGFRIRVDPKQGTNMRFDYAMGSGGNSGFYVSFGEAF